MDSVILMVCTNTIVYFYACSIQISFSLKSLLCRLASFFIAAFSQQKEIQNYEEKNAN